MYDRPTLAELIDAAREHVETQLIPLTRATDRKLYFQTLVAANVLKIAQREIDLSEAHAEAQWARLNALLGDDKPLPPTPSALRDAMTARNAQLTDAIESGSMDDSADLFDHLMQTTIEQLTVANPKYLATLAAEDEAS